MSNELATTKSFIPAPTSFDEAWRMSQVLADSDMVPKDFRGNPGNCMIAMQWGADLGIPGIQALQNIAVINGRPSIWGDAAKALVVGRPDCEDINEFFEGEGDNLTAVCIVKRKGKSATTSKFSLLDAKAANLLNKQGPWTQYRNRMLQMRARGFALRDAFPDALRGLSIAEESQDLGAEKEINPSATESAANVSSISKIDELLNAIKTMSINDFKSIDPAPFSKDEKAILRNAMEARRDEITLSQKSNVVADVVAERVVEASVNWEKSIKECGDSETLIALLRDMPESVQLEHGDLIDERSDFLRSK